MGNRLDQQEHFSNEAKLSIESWRRRGFLRISLVRIHTTSNSDAATASFAPVEHTTSEVAVPRGYSGVDQRRTDVNGNSIVTEGENMEVGMELATIEITVNVRKGYLIYE